MAQSGNRDTAFRVVTVTVVGAVIFGFLYNLFTGTMGSGMSYGQGLNINSVIVSTLVLAVKLLWLIFLISLATGLILLAKKYLVADKKVVFGDSSCKTAYSGYSCPCCGTGLHAEFRFCPNCKASLKDICRQCGKDLQVGWNSCPWCGTQRQQ